MLILGFPTQRLQTRTIVAFNCVVQQELVLTLFCTQALNFRVPKQVTIANYTMVGGVSGRQCSRQRGGPATVVARVYEAIRDRCEGRRGHGRQTYGEHLSQTRKWFDHHHQQPICIHTSEYRSLHLNAAVPYSVPTSSTASRLLSLCRQAIWLVVCLWSPPLPQSPLSHVFLPKEFRLTKHMQKYADPLQSSRYLPKEEEEEYSPHFMHFVP